MKSLMLQENQVRFNMFIPFEKSFQLTTDQPEMPDEFLSINLDQGYYVWGYANVPSVDLQGDMFPMETLKQMAPSLTRPPYNKIFLFHDYNDIASGTIIATAMDDKGMLVLAKLNEEHARIQEIWGSVQNKNLDGFSMGGSFLKVDTIEDEENGMSFNVVREAIATEVSLTSAPVNGESLIMGAFKKSREIMERVDKSEFNKSIKIEIKGDDKKFYINKEFMKSLTLEELQEKEKYISKQNLKKSMDTKEELNTKQKEVFDKAISEGKDESEAMKLASALLDKEAIEGTTGVDKKLSENPMKSGKENEATKKKELKKSLEDDEVAEEESVEDTEEVAEDKVDEVAAKVESGELEAGDEIKDSKLMTEDEIKDANKDLTSEEKEDIKKSEEDPKEEDYKEKYEKAIKLNEELTLELNKFKKSLPGEKSEENKPDRKSQKTTQTPDMNSDKANSPKSATPMLDWLRGK